MDAKRVVVGLLLAAVCAVAALSAEPALAGTTHNSATIRWVTVGDDSLTGQAASYDIRYSTSLITAANFLSATRWIGTPPKVPLAPGVIDSVVITGLQPSTQYWFAVKTADEVPNWSGISNVLQLTTAAPPDTTRPAAVFLQP